MKNVERNLLINGDSSLREVFFSTCFELDFVGLLASNLPHFLGIFPKN